MASNYQPNNAGLQALLRGPEVRAVLRARAEVAKALAEADAATFSDSGEYASHFEVHDENVTVRGQVRAAVDLVNTSGHAAAVEWGYRGRHGVPSTSAHRTLGKALDGLRGP